MHLLHSAGQKGHNELLGHGQEVHYDPFGQWGTIKTYNSGGKAMEQAIRSHTEVITQFLSSSGPGILKGMSKTILNAFTNGHRLYIMGNGGSAAQSEHLVAELVGRFSVSDRPTLPVFALTATSAVQTALANDFGFESVFERQVTGMLNSGDVLLALSTSGKSPNILSALKCAKKKNCKILGWTGENGNEMAPLCDLCLQVPSSSTPRIQEVHTLCIHLLCEAIDRAYEHSSSSC